MSRAKNLQTLELELCTLKRRRGMVCEAFKCIYKTLEILGPIEAADQAFNNQQLNNEQRCVQMTAQGIFALALGNRIMSQFSDVTPLYKAVSVITIGVSDVLRHLFKDGMNGKTFTVIFKRAIDCSDAVAKT